MQRGGLGGSYHTTVQEGSRLVLGPTRVGHSTKPSKEDEVVHQQTVHVCSMCSTNKEHSLSVCPAATHNIHAGHVCRRHHGAHIAGCTRAAHTHTTRSTKATQPAKRQLNCSPHNVNKCYWAPPPTKGHTWCVGEGCAEKDLQQGGIQATSCRVLLGNTIRAIRQHGDKLVLGDRAQTATNVWW